MIGYIVRILGNSLAIYAAARFVPGFLIDGGIKEFLYAGITLGLLNSTLKPIIKLVTTPIIIISLGLFIIVINALMIWIVDFVFPFVLIQNLTALLRATLLIGVVNVIIAWFIKIFNK